MRTILSKNVVIALGEAITTILIGIILKKNYNYTVKSIKHNRCTRTILLDKYRK